MASLLTNASAINDSNVSDAVAQISGHASAEAKREAEADAAYYRVTRDDPNEEKVREFYEQFTELKNRWSNKSNRSDKLVEEISDATYYYEEWVNAGHLDKDSNYGNPKYERRTKRWNTKFSKFIKPIRQQGRNVYKLTPEEKEAYKKLGKKPKKFGAVLNNLVTSLDQEARNWYPSSSDESSGGRRKRKTKRKRKKSRRKSRKKRKTRKKRKSKKKRRKRR